MFMDNMTLVNLDVLSHELHAVSVEKGFWDANNAETHTIFYLAKLSLISSEVSEVLEAIRKEKGEREVVEELADILIRTFDLYAGLVGDGYTNLSLHEVLMDKAAINQGRPPMHGVLA
jgi:NTP pyrophosphatase (non-canonical NTP hydrolase)